MGIKSTVTIERSDAIREVLAHLLLVSDKDLEMVLEYALGEKAHFYNFTVVSDSPRPQVNEDNRYRRGMFD